MNETETNQEFEEANTTVAEESSETPSSQVQEELTASRTDIHIPRRLFHLFSGLGVTLIYKMIIPSHREAVFTLGFFASLIYIIEQIRVNYPEFMSKYAVFNRYILRAEEQLKESASVPYVMAMLLTIITFPKDIAIASILTLAFADPLSAVIGIKYGRHKIVPHKSLEGSAAFFIATFLCVFVVFNPILPAATFKLVALSFFTALIASAFEMIPLKLDDNLTIPLVTAIILRVLCWVFGVPLL